MAEAALRAQGETSVELVELKPYRQTWLSADLMHRAPSAYLCVIDGKQYAQLEHPKGGPLTCVANRTGKVAEAVVKKDGKWFWQLPIPHPKGEEHGG
jgi:hypothetical protein